LHPELSYQVTGILFAIHNEIGRYGREKQYGDTLESKLKENGMEYKREHSIGNSGNVVDFLVEDKIVLELKAKRLLVKEDYYQTQRYLQEAGIQLGLLVNFRDEYLLPRRIVRIEQEIESKHS